jgi:hypothetical protein
MANALGRAESGGDRATLAAQVDAASADEVLALIDREFGAS